VKILKLLVLPIVLTCFFVSSAYSASESSCSFEPSGKCIEKQESDRQKDPIKELESRKEKIKKLQKEGKISKEKADKAISDIDLKIKKIEEFNKLPLEQRKSILIERFKTHIDNKVSEGKLTREQADIIVKDFTARIKAWDGKGYPKINIKK
jgi:polyhydroxyalkanoate synthesis regulator phasin